MSRFFVKRAFLAVPVGVFGALALYSYEWNIHTLEKQAQEIATYRGRLVYEMVQTTRLWNAKHGGVYVAVKEGSEPNPYLKVEERDIASPKGVALTKINPAYMTRQIGNLMAEGDVNIHLTSLKPINPGNEPLSWERKTLERFEAGEKEVVEILEDKGRDTFFYMAPLMVKEACMKCHRQQGYQVGDIRGGLRVSFPAAPIFAAYRPQQRNLALIHAVTWLLLSSIAVWGMNRVRREVLSLEAEKASRDTEIARRTEELRKEVAERKHSEAMFRESEATVRLLLHSTAEGIYAIDRGGTCIMCNTAAAELLGYDSEDDLIGQNIHSLIHHTRADGSPYPVEDCSIHKTAVTGEPATENREVFWKSDGTPFTVECLTSPMHRDGDLIGAVCSFTDISERKAAEDKLQESEARYRDLIEGSQLGIMIDRDMKPLFANDAFLQMFDCVSREELLSKDSVEVLIAEKDRERVDGYMRARMAGGEAPSEYEFEAVTKTGRIITVSNSVRVIDWKGEPATQSVMIDVTERRRAEDALEQHRIKLKRSNEELQQFAYAISHDLQEPLRMVTSYLQLLDKRLESNLENDLREFLNFAVDGGRRMQTMIRDLLEYSRVETQGERLALSDSTHALDAALQNLRITLQETGAQIDTPEMMPRVFADMIQLSRVFQNLIENGIKYRSEDRPIEIRIAVELGDNEWLFSVADNGIGMEEQYLDRIFGVFQRLHGRDKYEGTGIGLAVVKRIIVRHGGRIWVESTFGEGSTFYFTLPIVPENGKQPLTGL